MFRSNLLCANRSLIWERIFIVSPKHREPIRKILEAQYQLRSTRHEGLFLLEGDRACGVGLPPSLISPSLDFLTQKIEIP